MFFGAIDIPIERKFINNDNPKYPKGDTSSWCTMANSQGSYDIILHDRVGNIQTVLAQICFDINEYVETKDEYRPFPYYKISSDGLITIKTTLVRDIGGWFDVKFETIFHDELDPKRITTPPLEIGQIRRTCDVTKPFPFKFRNDRANSVMENVAPIGILRITWDPDNKPRCYS